MPPKRPAPLVREDEADARIHGSGATLRVVALRADGIRSVQWVGTQDPYVDAVAADASGEPRPMVPTVRCRTCEDGDPPLLADAAVRARRSRGAGLGAAPRRLDRLPDVASASRRLQAEDFRAAVADGYAAAAEASDASRKQVSAQLEAAALEVLVDDTADVEAARAGGVRLRLLNDNGGAADTLVGALGTTVTLGLAGGTSDDVIGSVLLPLRMAAAAALAATASDATVSASVSDSADRTAANDDEHEPSWFVVTLNVDSGGTLTLALSLPQSLRQRLLATAAQRERRPRRKLTVGAVAAAAVLHSIDAGLGRRSGVVIGCCSSSEGHWHQQR